ncbi:hypothetical protein FRC11_004510 [Ceratobasidium sp. 423]|nr:hypothetical protein FRC11_004510 [Ceratobasidium sp. 423]
MTLSGGPKPSPLFGSVLGLLGLGHIEFDDEEDPLALDRESTVNDTPEDRHIQVSSVCLPPPVLSSPHPPSQQEVQWSPDDFIEQRPQLAYPDPPLLQEPWKPSLKLSQGDGVVKTVTFSPTNPQVFFADDWDRSPVEVVSKLSYSDVLELKQHLSSDHAAMGLALLLSRIPFMLYPLIPEERKNPNSSGDSYTAAALSSDSEHVSSSPLVSDSSPPSPSASTSNTIWNPSFSTWPSASASPAPTSARSGSRAGPKLSSSQVVPHSSFLTPATTTPINASINLRSKLITFSVSLKQNSSVWSPGFATRSPMSEVPTGSGLPPTRPPGLHLQLVESLSIGPLCARNRLPPTSPYPTNEGEYGIAGLDNSLASGLIGCYFDFSQINAIGAPDQYGSFTVIGLAGYRNSNELIKYPRLGILRNGQPRHPPREGLMIKSDHEEMGYLDLNRPRQTMTFEPWETGEYCERAWKHLPGGTGELEHKLGGENAHKKSTRTKRARPRLRLVPPLCRYQPSFSIPSAGLQSVTSRSYGFGWTHNGRIYATGPLGGGGQAPRSPGSLNWGIIWSGQGPGPELSLDLGVNDIPPGGTDYDLFEQAVNIPIIQSQYTGVGASIGQQPRYAPSPPVPLSDDSGPHGVEWIVGLAPQRALAPQTLGAPQLDAPQSQTDLTGLLAPSSMSPSVNPHTTLPTLEPNAHTTRLYAMSHILGDNVPPLNQPTPASPSDSSQSPDYLAGFKAGCAFIFQMLRESQSITLHQQPDPTGSLAQSLPSSHAMPQLPPAIAPFLQSFINQNNTAGNAAPASQDSEPDVDNQPSTGSNTQTLRHGRVKMIYKCDSCDKTFPRKHRFTDHMNSFHKKIKGYLCDFPGCGGSFTTHGNMQRHRRIHTPVAHEDHGSTEE